MESTNIWTRFMFADSDWNAKRLMEVYESHKYLVAYSVWNNVTLRVWPNGLDKRARGYLSKLSLQFTDKSEWKETPVITEYKREWHQHHEKSKIIALCILTFLLIHPFWTGYIQAEESNGIHLYSDNPFDTSTPETVRKVLLEQKGLDVSLEELET